MEKIGRILVVDDEPDFVRGIQVALQAKPYEVVVAGNRNQAEAGVRANKPDAVVLGTIMPRGDAFLFHQWLKQTSRFNDVLILVVNARREEELTRGWRKDEGMQCEAEDFLAKPVEPSVLVSRIEKLLDRVTRRIRILVADDHAVVRDGIRAVLALQQDMQVIGDAVNGREALEKTIELSPDVVLMDIVMPVMNGLDATREICKGCPQAKVIMLTQYDDDENVLVSQQMGAIGFIPKTAVSSMLLTGIRSVSEGKQFVHTVAKN
ncbi:MAG: response regulator [Dehalococcoidales bacterium]|nr:MAG: response regulator [Dehalococcoidales bacterium]